MAVTSGTATITIIGGPDRGKVFELGRDLVRVGRGAQNEILLSDPELAEQPVQILNRNGRYAISTSVSELVEVDGNVLPPERWVWLPDSARIRVGRRNNLRFSITGAESALGTGAIAETDRDDALEADSEANTSDTASMVDPATATPKPRRRARAGEGGRKSTRKEASAGGRQVARFITDQKGDSLVKLGEDGQLPELTLTEAAGPRRKSKKENSADTSPWLIYVGVGCSVLLSVLLLLVDFDPSHVSASDRAVARQQIRDYYGDPEKGFSLKPYQILLRNAELERSRGNLAGERAAYRKVLDLLLAEDNNLKTGGIRGSETAMETSVTGSPGRDAELRRLIGILTDG